MLLKIFVVTVAVLVVVDLVLLTQPVSREESSRRGTPGSRAGAGTRIQIERVYEV